MEGANGGIYIQKYTQFRNRYTSNPHISSRFPNDMKLESIQGMPVCEVLIPAVMPFDISLLKRVLRNLKNAEY
jgi:hypothetical protein